MILEREQINRYLRHIIMPEISGPGQKKLLESSVFITGQNAREAASAVYYLAAAGVGRIYCHFAERTGMEELFLNARDLNSDISIELSEIQKGDYAIYLGRPAFIAGKCCSRSSEAAVPSVILLYNGWRGGMKTFRAPESPASFLASLPARSETSCREKDESLIAACVSGALGAAEVIKLILDIGETADDFLYFDLLCLEFMRTGMDGQAALMKLCSPGEESITENKMKSSKILIAGTGGLGSPAAYALALAGVGMLGLVDYDTVEISNLNRQILHSTSRLGRFKAESAAAFLEKSFPGIRIIRYNTGINRENVYEMIRDYDVVIDAVDNFPTRFLLNDACHFAGKPLIDAGVLRFDGTCTVFLPQKGPCYRCMLSEIPAPGSVPSCSEAGVLGPVPGVMGFIQAAEAVKLLTGCGTLSNGRIIIYDGLYSEFRTVELGEKNTCPLCGENPTIHELQEYAFTCGDREEED